jgi:hypothetical protein
MARIGSTEMKNKEILWMNMANQPSFFFK